MVSNHALHTQKWLRRQLQKFVNIQNFKALAFQLKVFTVICLSLSPLEIMTNDNLWTDSQTFYEILVKLVELKIHFK